MTSLLLQYEFRRESNIDIWNVNNASEQVFYTDIFTGEHSSEVLMMQPSSVNQ